MAKHFKFKEGKIIESHWICPLCVEHCNPHEERGDWDCKNTNDQGGQCMCYNKKVHK